jgi:RNA polymerase sigma factor (TIGR02999 family)
MRRILVDQARARGATKRGGGQAQVTLTDSLCLGNGNPLDVLAVHEALTALEALNPRHAKVAEMRFFAGMSFEEIAAVLGVTSRTLKTDWAMARVWLLKQLGGE